MSLPDFKLVVAVAVLTLQLRGAPERGHLEDLGVVVEVQVRQLEAAADDPAVARKRPLHLLGPGLGGDVVVFGTAPKQQIPDRAADQVRFESSRLQALYSPQRILIQ